MRDAHGLPRHLDQVPRVIHSRMSVTSALMYELGGHNIDNVSHTIAIPNRFSVMEGTVAEVSKSVAEDCFRPEYLPVRLG